MTEELSNHNLQSSQQSNTLLSQNTELRAAKAETEKQLIELQNEVLLKTQEYDKLQVDNNTLKKQNKIMEVYIYIFYLFRNNINQKLKNMNQISQCMKIQSNK